MKPLFFEENHCASCPKVFCCFNCRLKHDNRVHRRRKPSRIKNSSISIQAKVSNSSVQFENSKYIFTVIPRKRGSIHIYEDQSYLLLNKKVNPCDKKNSDENKDDTFLQSSANCSSKILNQEVLTEKNHIRAVGKDINTKNLFSDLNFEENAKENVPPQNNQNLNKATRINPVSKSPLEYGDISETTVSVINSSLRGLPFQLAYSENGENNKSDNDPKWRTALTNFSDSTANELKLNSENSSIYYACSESLMTFQNLKSETKAFEKFEVGSKHASTKFDVTISLSQEPSHINNNRNETTEDYVCTISTEYDIAEKCIISISESSQTETCTETTVSATESTHSLVDFGNFNLMNTEPDKLPSEKPKELVNQWSEGDEDENSGEGLHLIEKVNIPVEEHTFTVPSDKSFWQSFSSSLHRAYNSTKQLCNKIGRKNKSKRNTDDAEEQPRPKRQKILCRPPIKDEIKIVLIEDGDRRRPVLAFDKGSQTDW